MEQETQSSFCANSVRRNDPDRFILTMLAPSAMRESLFALYAFNVEIARTRELVSEPPLGEIRLQWWRDDVEAFYANAVLRHGISSLLCDTITAHALTRSNFDRLIDARSADLDDGFVEGLCRAKAFGIPRGDFAKHHAAAILAEDLDHQIVTLPLL